MSKKRKISKENKMELAGWSEKIAPYLYNWDLMENRCTTSAESFEPMVAGLPGGSVVRRHEKDDPYLFIDKGADILAVAHLDATGAQPHFGRVKIGNNWWVLSRWLDDRLGAFLILDVLPRFFNYDILLTVGEEFGHSTARNFEPPEGKHYQWMFELDRMQTDVVWYQYKTKELEEALRSVGFNKLEHGSYTDIVELSKLGCSGFNVGIGYEDNHGDWSRANLTDTLSQMAKFAMFFEKYQQTTFVHDTKITRYSGGTQAVQTYSQPSGEWVDGEYRTFHDKYSSRFEVGQVVKEISTGTLLIVASFSWYKGNEHVVWCSRKVGNNGAYSGSNVSESNLTDELTYEEELQARKTWPHGKLLGPIPEKPKDNAAGVPAERWNELVLLAEGPHTGPTCKEARLVLEELLTGEVLVSSYEDGIGKHGHRINRFKFGEPVYTDEHDATHKGTIDCEFPCISRNGTYWWVRFDAPDKHGLYVDLMNSSVISHRNVPATKESNYEPENLANNE